MEVLLEVYICPHAMKSIQERLLPEDIVKAVVRNPEQVVPSDDSDRKFYQRRYLVNGKVFLVRVLVADTGKPPVFVITAYRTSRIEKYWRDGGGD